MFYVYKIAFGAKTGLVGSLPSAPLNPQGENVVCQLSFKFKYIEVRVLFWICGTVMKLHNSFEIVIKGSSSLKVNKVTIMNASFMLQVSKLSQFLCSYAK